jgi:hypothetical protein
VALGGAECRKQEVRLFQPIIALLLAHHGGAISPMTLAGACRLGLEVPMAARLIEGPPLPVIVLVEPIGAAVFQRLPMSKAPVLAKTMTNQALC